MHILLDLGVAPRGKRRRGLPDAAPRLRNRRMLEKLGFRKRLKTKLLQLSQMQTIIKEVKKKKKKKKKTKKQKQRGEKNETKKEEEEEEEDKKAPEKVLTERE